MNKTENLLKKIIEKKLITEKQLNIAKNKANELKKTIEEILVDDEFINTEDLAIIKADLHGLPYINLLDKKIEHAILNIIPHEAAENYHVICFEKDNDEIKVGLAEPENYKAIEALNFLVKEEKLKIKYYLISKLSFKKSFKQYKNLIKEIDTALKVKEQERIDMESDIQDFESNQILKSAPITKMVSVIIRHAVEGRASDIHIEPTKENSRVRYRIDGVLHTSLILPKEVHSSIIARIKVLANLKLDETRIPQDGRFRMSVNNNDVDFRTSILPLVGEEKVVMRILDTTKKAPILEELGYGGRELRIINDNIKKTNGMFLVTGPTGSGKSTTLFSILNMLNQEGLNISTLEDPVEYFVQGVNQTQVNPSIDFTFASGLRSLLRQDPDIIMVGEIRDEETAELAVHASLTGHFVLSTLHTNSTIGTIPRLVDMHIEQFLLGSTLNVIVAQRLARKLCVYCKKEIKLPKDIIKDIENEFNKMSKESIREAIGNFDGLEKITTYEAIGCSKCGNSGYNGRVAIVELLDINEDVKKKIINGERILENDDVVKNQNFISLKQNGILKVIQGVTTIEEVLRVTKS